MTVSIPNEPWAALGTLFTTDTDLLALVAIDSDHRPMAFADMPVDSGPYPRVTWRAIGEGLGGTDAEDWLKKTVRLQVDAYATEPMTCNDLELAIDNLALKLGTGPLDCAHWVVTMFRRVSPWRHIDLPLDFANVDGKPIFQRSADFLFKYGRNQDLN